MTAQQLYDRNHAILRRVLRMMETLPAINGNPPERPETLVKLFEASGKKVSISISLSSISPPLCKLFLQSAAGTLTSVPALHARPESGRGHGRRLSAWVASQDSTGDPLWGNLLYW